VRVLVIALALAGGLAGAREASAVPAAAFDHAPLDALLRRYVRGTDVAYREWHGRPRDRAALASYVARLAAADTTGWTRDEQLAFWINAYNAITVARILEAYPVSSITKVRPTFGIPGIPGNGVWKEIHRVAGADVSLDDIEHGTLRKHFAEPRIHFAVNCAAKSCPPLAGRAYFAADLDASLDAAAGRFIRAGRYNTIEPGRRWALSKIFQWYEDDFVAAAGSVPAFILPYLPPERARGVDPAKVRWSSRGYDWSLNEP
jgi:hypothetical protein